MNFVDNDPIHALDPASDVRLIHRLFNSSSASRRLFSEIHYYVPQDPDLTIGMGHWIRGNISKLFKKLKDDSDTWDLLTEIWASSLEDHHWIQIRNETGYTGGSQETVNHALSSVLCIDNNNSHCIGSTLELWADGVGEEFNSAHHWFTAGWQSVSRAEPVARAQVQYWKESVLAPGKLQATKRNLTTRGGVACVISAKSSGLANTMFGIGAKEASATGDGVSRSWSLLDVPSEARPDNMDNLSAASLLQDWKAVVAWQFYTLKKRRVRSRMREIWSEFFEVSWGPLENPNSVLMSTRVPKHRGTSMENREYDFTVVFRE